MAPKACSFARKASTDVYKRQEYNLANISEGQEVVLTSKVYPDKTWTGKISYVANYPTDAGQAGANAAGGTQGSLSLIHI